MKQRYNTPHYAIYSQSLQTKQSAVKLEARLETPNYLMTEDWELL